VNQGSQPAMPPMVNCWDDFQFDTNDCKWINQGIEPAVTLAQSGAICDGGVTITTTVTPTNDDQPTTCELSGGSVIAVWNMNACASFSGQSSAADYSDLTAHTTALSCAGVSTVGLYTGTGVNHSCTNDAITGAKGDAVCVGMPNIGTFQDNHPKAVKFDVKIDPTCGINGITKLEFQELAPEQYTWSAAGHESVIGTNNYPTQYGIRVLKDGVEIYKEVDIPTTTAWSLETFDFLGDAAFQSATASTYTFELLAYNLAGVASDVSAWDLDNIKVYGASCEISDGNTYTWTNTAGETVGTSTTLTVTTGGEYCVSVINANGCEATNCILVEGCSFHVDLGEDQEICGAITLSPTITNSAICEDDCAATLINASFEQGIDGWEKGRSFYGGHFKNGYKSDGVPCKDGVANLWMNGYVQAIATITDLCIDTEYQICWNDYEYNTNKSSTTYYTRIKGQYKKHTTKNKWDEKCRTFIATSNSETIELYNYTYAATTLIDAIEITTNGSNSSSELTYLWVDANGVASTSETLKATTAGTYTLQVTDCAGNVASDFVTLTDCANPCAEQELTRAACNDIKISADGNKIAIENQSSFDCYTYNVKVYNTSWKQIASLECTENAGCHFAPGAKGWFYVLAALYDLDGKQVCFQRKWIYIKSNLQEETGSIHNRATVASTTTSTTKVLSSEVNVYPNPASYELNLDLNAYQGQAVQVKMFNTVHQIVYQQQLTAQEIGVQRISVSSLQGGIYFIEIQAADAAPITKRVMVVK